MSILEIPLSNPIEDGSGLIEKVVFKKRPAAKQLIDHGSFLNPDTSINWVALGEYINDLTDLGPSEIGRIDQLDFSAIGQKLSDWVFFDEKKSPSSTK